MPPPAAGHLAQGLCYGRRALVLTARARARHARGNLSCAATAGGKGDAVPVRFGEEYTAYGFIIEKCAEDMQGAPPNLPDMCGRLSS